jgi:hypothetical protein
VMTLYVNGRNQPRNQILAKTLPLILILGNKICHIFKFCLFVCLFLFSSIMLHFHADALFQISFIWEISEYVSRNQHHNNSEEQRPHQEHGLASNLEPSFLLRFSLPYIIKVFGGTNLLLLSRPHTFQKHFLTHDGSLDLKYCEFLLEYSLWVLAIDADYSHKLLSFSVLHK